MELPHWLMAVGAILLVVGFLGLALRKNVQVTSPGPDGWEGDQTAEAHGPQDGITNPASASAAS
jgi:hypothetical protein